MIMLVFSARGQGITFVHDLSWQQILQKAVAEDKYIFVDCFATWCGPCKRMDKKIYSDDSIGVFTNERFISVKIQMDTTRQDNDEVRKWYVMAHSIMEDYHISAYPTYLFFSPTGRAMHKRIGEMNRSDFIGMEQAAKDSNQQYYTLLCKYRDGARDYVSMPVLMTAAEQADNYTLATQVKKEYVHDYLDKLPGGVTWNRENVDLLNRFSLVMNCNDRIFQSYYQNRFAIDSIMREPHFADRMINWIIYHNQVKPYLDSIIHNGRKPDWSRLKRGLNKSYDALYINKSVLDARVEYYKAKMKWKQYVKYFIEQQENAGIAGWQLVGVDWSFNRLMLNNAAYTVFLYGNKRQVERALSWVDRSLSLDSTYFYAMDTKANILYKLGRNEEGLKLEEKVYHLVSTGFPDYSEIQDSYEKMKKGLPTWVSE